MFDSKEYDPTIYQKVVENYSLGKTYIIEKWVWDYDKDREPKSINRVTNTFDCPTLEKFDEELWDLFSQFIDENGQGLIWGSPISLKDQNPKRKMPMYFDGLINSLCRKECIECIENRSVSRFMSLLVHFGYFNLNFIVVE